LAIGLMACIGCGPYRVTYVMPSRGDHPPTITRKHAHGIGPLLIGGGGLFGVLNPMSPALFDYTGAVKTTDICPNGFSRVEHYHTFDQNALAALISWFALVNAYHPSTVDWSCVPD
jgi:hypothetical protein